MLQVGYLPPSCQKTQKDAHLTTGELNSLGPKGFWENLYHTAKEVNTLQSHSAFKEQLTEKRWGKNGKEKTLKPITKTGLSSVVHLF